MSDVMLFGVLEMPFNMAMSDELSRAQYWQRGQEAATKLRDLAAQVEDLQADAARLDFLEKNAVISKNGQSLREAVDAAREQS